MIELCFNFLDTWLVSNDSLSVSSEYNTLEKLFCKFLMNNVTCTMLEIEHNNMCLAEWADKVLLFL